MKRCFVFCHGFAFDKSFWENLQPYFIKEECIFLDLGYFSEKYLPHLEQEDMEFIGIGHSLGLLKLLSLNIKFAYLIGLNSFVNFLGNEEKLHLKRAQELQILKNNFIAHPIATLKHFYRTCGVSIENSKIVYINKEPLLEDLEFIAKSFALQDESKTLIIGSKDDAIVPVQVTEDNFTNYILLDQGGHGLGVLQAEIIYQNIMSFLNNNEKQNPKQI